MWSIQSLSAAYGIGKPKFDEYRSKLPKDFDVVAAGGWYSLQKKYGKKQKVNVSSCIG